MAVAQTYNPEARREESERVAWPSTNGTLPGKGTIKVVGVGVAGSNAVARVYQESDTAVKYYCLNTDQQQLERCFVPNKILLGLELTGGLGSGGDPEVGRKAAEESREKIQSLFEGVDLVVITSGLGGGTGTGATPVVAAMAKEAGAHVAVIATEPFSFEAVDRHESAKNSLNLLRKTVDTLVVISHGELMQQGRRTKENLSWDDVLECANSRLDRGIQTLSEISTMARSHKN